MDTAFTFDDRVRQIDRRIREIEATVSSEIKHDVGAAADTATWEREGLHATLILHRDEAPPRLALFLHTGSVEHPEALQIGFYEADVIDMVARPIAGLLSGSAG